MLIGLVGAVVITVVAGARRSASAYTRFHNQSLAGDLTLFYSNPGRLEQIARLSEVLAVGRIFSPFFAPLSSEPGGDFRTVVSPDGRFLNDVDRVRVVAGRALDADRAA